MGCPFFPLAAAAVIVVVAAVPVVAAAVATATAEGAAATAVAEEQNQDDDPKKKKVKHLRAKPIMVNVDGATLPNKHLQDSDLRNALSAHGLEISTASQQDADSKED